MADYYIEIPKRKIGIELPNEVEVTRKTKDRFYFVTCEDENAEFFEYWLDSNGINYQET